MTQVIEDAVDEDAVDDTTKFYAELKEIQTEVMAIKSFVLEQFPISNRKRNIRAKPLNVETVVTTGN